MSRPKIINLAVIAHVDAGKSTLVDAFLTVAKAEHLGYLRLGVARGSVVQHAHCTGDAQRRHHAALACLCLALG